MSRQKRPGAVIDALEHDMGSTLATKHDILTLATKQDILLVKQDVLLLKQELKHLGEQVARDSVRLDEQFARELEILRASMTVRLGSIQVVTAGLLFAALKLS